MKLTFKLFACIILFLGMMSCTKDDSDVSSSQKVKAVISAGIRTRAVDNQWGENDAIGIMMLKKGTTGIAENCYNRHYTTANSGTTGQFVSTSESSVIYFPQDGSEVDFKSYYPYSKDLGQDMLIPVNVSDQKVLPVIDLMTADHLAGTSKAEPNVMLHFHHRLSKLIFNLMADQDGNPISLKDCRITIKGMYTTGSYNLQEERLIVNNSSMAEIGIATQNGGETAKAQGIVMPRTRGAGVVFEFTTSAGQTYTARMSDTLSLNPGYKYTFNIKLKTSPVTVSATIEEWLEGASSDATALAVSTPAEDSKGVEPGASMNVYTGTKGLLATFDFQDDKKWYSRTPVYWEGIDENPATFRASILAAGELNDTQLPDWLIAKEISVERNKGVNFELEHVTSKVLVKLISKDNTFSNDELKTAVITLPGFPTGGSESDGRFVPGTATGNILLQEGVALFQPYIVKTGEKIIIVTIKGRDYIATASDSDFSFNAGEAKLLTVDINKSKLEVSARIVDWKSTADNVGAIIISTPAGPSNGVIFGNEMNLYLVKNTPPAETIGTYVYKETDKWEPAVPAFWESIDGEEATFRAAITAVPRLNDTQLPDWLIARDTIVKRYKGIDFYFRHVVSKVTVKLVSGDGSFKENELKSAKIIFPNYLTGGSETNGLFVEGSAKADILAQDGVALFQPQTIGSGEEIIHIEIAGRRYTAKAGAADFVFAANEHKALTVDVSKVKLEVSAKVIGWDETEAKLTAIGINTTPADANAGELLSGDVMNLYIKDGAETVKQFNTYTWDGAKWNGIIVYWENIVNEKPLFRASVVNRAPLHSTQLADILIAADTEVERNKAVNLTFRHAAAKVAVQLTSTDDTFTAEELKTATIVLPDYVTGGTVENGLFMPGSTKGDIDVAINSDASSAIALFQPQTKSGDIVWITIKGRKYMATATSGIEFAAGVSTLLKVDIKKTKVDVSATVIDWTKGSEISLVGSAISISGTTGTTEEFFTGKNVGVYVLDGDKDPVLSSFAYDGSKWTANPALWWDAFSSVVDIAAVYPSTGFTVKDKTQFDWAVPADQSGGYKEELDLLLSLQKTVNAGSAVNFKFNHALSLVKVVIDAANSTGFTAAELKKASVTLDKLSVNGTADLATGIVTASASVTTITPKKGSDELTYTALVMPQVIATDIHVVNLTLDGKVYPGKLAAPLKLEAGKEGVITLKLTKTGVSISATLENWSEGDKGNIEIQ